MLVQATTAKMKAQLAGVNVTVSEFCRKAGIARSTWDRWDRGETFPNMKTWAQVETAFQALVPPPEAAE